MKTKQLFTKFALLASAALILNLMPVTFSEVPNFRMGPPIVIVPPT